MLPLSTLVLLITSFPSAQESNVGLERAFPRLRFERPVFLTGAGDGTGRLFVVEQGGRIRVFEREEDVVSSKIFLDLSDQVSRVGNEEGLLGLAFAPDYARSGAFYVHYSSSLADEVGIVSRFLAMSDDPDRADPDSEEVILEQPQPYRNHNGGMLAFGPDEMLYVSFGDGGAADDPHENGQDLGSWLGSILRLDVSAAGPGYDVPADNPFVDRDGARPEIWAFGLRNVWRFSFDRETGVLWAADIGQNLWEEVNIIEGGGNYGWNTFEASSEFSKGGQLAPDSEPIPPVAEYGRTSGISVTGGYVYRGARYPALQGRYFYGDYASGNLWSISAGEDGAYRERLEGRTGRSISSFGEDDEGELYLTSFDGGLYRLVPSEQPLDPFAHWPRLLSETGLFESVAEHKTAANVVPYEVNAPFWSDGASKQRFFALPEGKAFGYAVDDNWRVPVGTTFIKSFRTATLGRNAYVETRLIKRSEAGWEAATYLWNDSRSEATLAPEGRQFELYKGQSEVTTWHAPSSSECALCHVEAAGFVLGLTTRQLNRDSQLEEWIEGGFLNAPADFDPSVAPAFPSPYDEAAALETRARTWLDVNCAMCHYPNGPGNAAIDLRHGTPLAETGLVDGEVAQGDLGVSGARIVKAGEPEHSTLWQRVRTRGEGRMPNVGSNEVDEQGAKLLADWIKSLERE